MAEQKDDPRSEVAQAKAAAESWAEAQKNRSDETVPGGKYLVNGVLVNSEGEAIKDKDK